MSGTKSLKWQNEMRIARKSSCRMKKRSNEKI